MIGMLTTVANRYSVKTHAASEGPTEKSRASAGSAGESAPRSRRRGEDAEAEGRKQRDGRAIDAVAGDPPPSGLLRGLALR